MSSIPSSSTSSSASKIDLNLFNKNSTTIEQPQNSFSLGHLFIVFFLLLSLFFIIIINRLWLFITIIVLILIYLLYQKKYLFSIITLVVGGIIIFIQFWLLPKIHHKEKCDYSRDDSPSGNCPTSSSDLQTKKNNCVESFYTLFTPFSNEAEQMKFINTSVLSPQATKRLSFRNKKLTFLAMNDSSQSLIMENFSKLLLSYSNILKLELTSTYYPETIVKNVAQDKTELGMVPAPVLSHFNQFANLRFLGNIGKYYLFCITTTSQNIGSLFELKNKTIGVPSNMKIIWENIKFSLFNSSHSNLSVFFSQEDLLFSKLQKNEIGGFFWAGTFPNPFIDNIIHSNLSHKYHFIPLSFADEKAFMQNNKVYQPVTLNFAETIPSKSFPDSFGRFWMNHYNASYLTISFHITLFTNEKMDNFTGFEIAKTLFSSRKLLVRNMNIFVSNDIRINNLTQPIQPSFFQLSPLDIAEPSVLFPIQDGAKKFYEEKGMISYCGNPKCILKIGIEKCTLCDNK
jgi:TRAP-type uncharacterized transport system substrate-binding protein